MPFSPPVAFVPGTTLQSADLQGNQDALRIYLHGGVITSDLNLSKWVQTRHVQPPLIDPIRELQHGVTGWQGGQWGGGSLARLTFATSYLTGGGLQGASPNEWMVIPQTSFTLSIRKAAHVIYHWVVEVQAGPDDVPYVAGRNYQAADRLVYVAPYFGNPSLKQTGMAQETRNNVAGFNASAPYGAESPYTLSGYGQRDGSFHTLFPGVGEATVGLCSYSQVTQAAIVNWNVAIEVFYL